MKNEILRQGDVLMMRVAAVAKGATAKAKGAKEKVILALGELTGHHHRFEKGSGVTLLERDSGEQFINVTKPAALVHEEHDQIFFKTGKFQRAFQVEDFGEEIRRVVD